MIKQVGFTVLFLLISVPAFADSWDIYNVGVANITPAQITGDPAFDYFFTIVAFFGLLAFAIALIVGVISRS
ncbi:MAG: hypothetical protein M0033_10080 [Nitrospiraceae bacterium]|nr:hypothetical protein [Nitrospiraceae bacterium]